MKVIVAHKRVADPDNANKVEGGKLSCRRPMFAGNAFAWCTLQTPAQVVTARHSEFGAAESVSETSPFLRIPTAAPGAAAERIERRA